jgi:hypothetical protein
VLLMLRCRLSAATLAYVLYSMLGMAIRNPMGDLGRTLIESVGPHSLYVWLGRGPLASLQLHTYWICGAFALSLVNAVICYPIVAVGVRRYREKVMTRLESSRLLRTLRKIWLFRVLKWVFVGGISLARD